MVVALAITGRLVFFRPAAGPWAETLGGSSSDYFNDVAVTSDGGIIAVGYTDSADGDFPIKPDNLSNQGDAVIAKFAADGTLAWAKTLGGSYDDAFNGVAITPDNGVIVVGRTDSTDGDFAAKPDNVDPETGLEDAAVGQLATDGTLTWTKTFGGANRDLFGNIAITSDGSIIAAGDTFSAYGDFPAKYGSADPFNQSVDDAVIARLTSDGQLTKQ